MIRTRINGEEREFGDGLSLAQIIQQLGVPASFGYAVAVNDAVVPKTRHESYQPKDGDAIEIIRAVAGG